jgi:hypothetical protein
VTVTERERVSRVQAFYPASWRRVRSVCVYASYGFDLDAHAARIVLAARERRMASALPPQDGRTP